MSIRTTLRILLLVIGTSGCGESFDIYSPKNIHKTVTRHRSLPGHYRVTYNERYVLEGFGPGKEKVLEDVMKVPDNEKSAVWHRAYREVIPRYLEAKGLIPDECANGVVVTGSSSTLAQGIATFRCKQ